MKNLGFIILPDGTKFEFGEYHPYYLRDRDNVHHYHNTSFQSEVLESLEWQEKNIILPDNFEINSGLKILGSIGIIVGLNKTEGAWEPAAPELIFVSPDSLTEEQIKIIENEKENLEKYFYHGLSDIRVINNSCETVAKLKNIKEYCEVYVSQQKNSKNR